MTMKEIDRITLHFALCLEIGKSKRYHLRRMAGKYKRNTRSAYIRQIMEALLLDPDPVRSVREVVGKFIGESK
jgi:hypothetical protein